MQKSVQVREFVDVYVKKNRSKWPMSELHSWIYMKKAISLQNFTVLILLTVAFTYVFESHIITKPVYPS